MTASQEEKEKLRLQVDQDVVISRQGKDFLNCHYKYVQEMKGRDGHNEETNANYKNQMEILN